MTNSTILVVDDELFFRRLYADLLGKAGYHVEAVATGEEALERLRRGGIDLLLTDLVMPGLSGLDLLRQARMMENPPEVILATGHATLETAIQALKAGARDYLVKPFRAEQLCHLVHLCLEQRRLLDENTLLKRQIRLFQQGQHLASLLEINRLMSQALDLLLQEIEEGRGFGFLLDSEGRISCIPATKGLRESEATALAQALLPRFGEDSAGLIIRREDILAPEAAPESLKTLWLFPLYSQKQLRGGIVLANPEGRDFPSLPRQQLLFLAEQTALGFHNACLYQGTCDLIHIDDLTGLHNYRYLQTILSREIQRTRRYGLCFSLVFIDLDHFKTVNDTYGHLAGSAALKEVAQVLRGSVREVDLLFRYGGDEFTVLLVETGASGAATVAERIRRQIENHVFLCGQNLSVRLTATVGYACFPDDARSKEGIIDIADRAMYHGKKIRNVSRGAQDLGIRHEADEEPQTSAEDGDS